MEIMSGRKAFQFTSPQGGRRDLPFTEVNHGYFNSRPHKGDDGQHSVSIGLLGISIHVPTRGTTPTLSSVLPPISYFNSRPHKGDDGQLEFIKTEEKPFQFTSPQGGRLAEQIQELSSDLFQFTSPQGGRRRMWVYLFDVVISIHVPTRGTTAAVSDLLYSEGISIHVPTRGTTSCPPFCVWPYSVFQFTSPQGGRLPSRIGPASVSIFQFTSPQGGRRPGSAGTHAGSGNFNSRPHKGDDTCVISPFVLLHISIHVPTRGTT